MREARARGNVNMAWPENGTRANRAPSRVPYRPHRRDRRRSSSTATSAGEIDVDSFVSHKLSLDDVNRGFELMEAQDGIRSVLELA